MADAVAGRAAREVGAVGVLLLARAPDGCPKTPEQVTNVAKPAFAAVAAHSASARARLTHLQAARVSYPAATALRKTANPTLPSRSPPAGRGGCGRAARQLPQPCTGLQTLPCQAANPNPAELQPSRRTRRMRARCAPAATAMHRTEQTLPCRAANPNPAELQPSRRSRRMQARCAPAAARWRRCTCAACWRARSCACCCPSWPSARAWCARGHLSNHKVIVSTASGIDRPLASRVRRVQ